MRKGKRRPAYCDCNFDDPRETVEALISGMPLSRVPEDRHPALLSALSAARNEASVAGHWPIVKRLQSVIAHLQLHPGLTPPQIRAQLQRVADRETHHIRRANNDNEEEIIDELVHGRPSETVDGARLNSILPRLKERRDFTVSGGDYRTSQKLEDLIHEVNQRQLEHTYSDLKFTRFATLELQLRNAKQELENAEQFWKDHIEAFNAVKSEAETSLEEKHRQQLEDYDASFPDLLPPNFRKMSVHVLQLREQEKHLVLTHRYEEAIPFHDRSDKMETNELDQQRDRFEGSFDTQRQLLLETQEAQFYCLLKNFDRKWVQLERAKEAELSARAQLVANLERRIEKMRYAPVDPDAAGISPLQLKTLGSRVTMPGPAGAINLRVRSVAASRINYRPIMRRSPPSRDAESFT
jgi:hypothetical protein